EDPTKWSQIARIFEEYLRRAQATPRNSAQRRHIPSALLQAATAYRKFGNSEKAKQSLRRFVSLYPKHELVGDARVSLAELERAGGDSAAALATFRQAVKTATGPEAKARALLEVGTLERDQKLFRESMQSLDQAVKVSKSRGVSDELKREVALQRALSYTAGGRADEGTKHLRQFVRAYPTGFRSADGRIELGYALIDAAKYSDAIEIVSPLVSATASTTRRVDALYIHGWSNARLAEVSKDEAKRAEHWKSLEADYRQILENYGTSAIAKDAQLELGEHFLRRGELESAKKELESLVASVEGSKGADRLLSRGLFALACVRSDAKEHGVARGLFDRVVEVESRTKSNALMVPALFHSARAWMKSRGEREAAERFQRISAQPRANAGEYYDESLLRLGECYHRLQEYPKAISTFQRLLKESPKSPLVHEARFGHGFALQFMDRPKDAIKELRKVVTGTQQVVAARAQYHIGECFLDQDQAKEAAREFLSVVAGFDFDGPYRAWVRRALLSAGLAYEKAGDTDAARKQWGELIERFSGSDEAKAAKRRLEKVR
ncbi:MAG: tetratricopeptide repeat protein, partial [Planctomycetota bacterium]